MRTKKPISYYGQNIVAMQAKANNFSRKLFVLFNYGCVRMQNLFPDYPKRKRACPVYAVLQVAEHSAAKLFRFFVYHLFVVFQGYGIFKNAHTCLVGFFGVAGKKRNNRK